MDIDKSTILGYHISIAYFGREEDSHSLPIPPPELSKDTVGIKMNKPTKTIRQPRRVYGVSLAKCAQNRIQVLANIIETIRVRCHSSPTSPPSDKPPIAGGTKRSKAKYAAASQRQRSARRNETNVPPFGLFVFRRRHRAKKVVVD